MGSRLPRRLATPSIQGCEPGTGVTPDRFWSSYAAILRDLAPRNAALLARRDELQAKIDAWHAAHPAKPISTVR